MNAAPQRPSTQETVTQESLLRAAAERVGRVREGRVAVHLHLSGLRPHNRQEGHIRIVLRMLDPLIHFYRGQIFLLSNSDVVFLCAEAPQTDLDAIIFRLRALFSKDPLTFADSGEGHDDFATVYDLELLYAGFLALTERLDAEARRRQQEGQKAPVTQGLTPSRLAEVVERIAGIDIARLVRRQAAIALGEKAKVGALFQEYFFSVADLQRLAAPDTNLLANRWLFQHLSQALDQHMLRALQGADLQQLPPVISLNLNMATLLSPAFASFTRWLGDRAGLIVEAQIIDVFADLGGYFFARDRLREAGHKVLLDGLSPLTLQLMDIGLYDADLFKLSWSPDLAAGGHAAEVRTAFAPLGLERVILGRCDSERAIQWGLANGITRFQGRFVDAMYAAVAMTRCPAASACTLAQCTARHTVIAGPQRGECGNLAMLDSFPDFQIPGRKPGGGNG